MANEFFSGLVTHWEAQAADAGYEILVVSSGDDPNTETRRIQSLIARRVDGLLTAASRDDFGADARFPSTLPSAVLVDRASANKRGPPTGMHHRKGRLSINLSSVIG